MMYLKNITLKEIHRIFEEPMPSLTVIFQKLSDPLLYEKPVTYNYTNDHQAALNKIPESVMDYMRDHYVFGDEFFLSKRMNRFYVYHRGYHEYLGYLHMIDTAKSQEKIQRCTPSVVKNPYKFDMEILYGNNINRKDKRK